MNWKTPILELWKWYIWNIVLYFKHIKWIVENKSNALHAFKLAATINQNYMKCLIIQKPHKEKQYQVELNED